MWIFCFATVWILHIVKCLDFASDCNRDFIVSLILSFWFRPWRKKRQQYKTNIYHDEMNDELSHAKGVTVLDHLVMKAPPPLKRYHGLMENQSRCTVVCMFEPFRANTVQWKSSL